MSAADPFARPMSQEDIQAHLVGLADDLIVGGRYKLPDPAGVARYAKFTRATTFAKTIADTYRLNLWRNRMAIKGVTMREDLYAATAAASLEDRDKLNELVESAVEVAGGKTRANLGTAVHSFTEQIDRGEITPAEVPGTWRRDVLAYAAALDKLGLEVVPEYIERVVLNQTFGIAGTFDRIVRTTKPVPVRVQDPDATGGYRMVTIPAGVLVMFDLKTGRDLEYAWHEIAIQLALYENADLLLNREAWCYQPMPDMHAGIGLVLHLPVGAGKATVYGIDTAAGWQAARICHQAIQWRKVRNLADPLTVAEVASAVQADSGPLELVTTREATWEERAATATNVYALSRLKIDATRAGAWTPSVEAAALKRRDQILADAVTA